jgi:EAL domain-containing protein (putative c-di-GMP-specific phosphodiesterase class I)
LTYISDFDVKTVKIDTSLVRAIITDVQQREIVSSVVRLASQLGLQVIVEGVETRGQLNALTALGVNYFQGYYFSRPLASSDLVAFVSSHGVVARKQEAAPPGP